MTKSDAYFISDAHLGVNVPGHNHRQQDLLSFLSGIRDSASHLFILGDFFDFWIEYPGLIRSDYFTAVHALRCLVESGTEVHYLAGNHDFALGPFLPDTVGVRTHPDSLDITIQGRALHLFHGDGLLRFDVGYRFLRKVLRNRLYQRLYKMLHPTLGIALANRCSRASRLVTGPARREWFLAEYRAAAKKILGGHPDIVMFGHTHRAEIAVASGKVYCNTGEWIREYTYARLRDGTLTLWRHTPGTADQSVAPSVLK